VPSEIEQAYVDQGYRLPKGLSWQAVQASRAKWAVDPILVPVAVAPGCVGWGVPFIDWKPLKHR
jgi:hypothetical protein